MYESMDLKYGLIILISIGFALASDNHNNNQLRSVSSPLSAIDPLLRPKRDLITAETGAGAGIGGGGGAFKKVSVC